MEICSTTICVTKDELSYLVDNGFKATDMAHILGISDVMAHRWLKDFNLQISHLFSTVDDNTLHGIVCSTKEEFPNSGFRMVCGVLPVSTLMELALVDVLRHGSTDNAAVLLAEFVNLGVVGLVDELELELSSSSLTTCPRRFFHCSNNDLRRSWPG